jgi:hypothetical protein
MTKLYISLGNECCVKAYIIDSIVTQPTYMFDWLRVFCVKDIINVFKNNFEDFMNEIDFVSDDQSPIGAIQPNPEHINKYNKKYNYTVKHDFTIREKDTFELVKDRYNRRIERFKEDCKDSETVFIRFILNDENINDYLELYKELQIYAKNSILILIHNQNNINIDNKNIYLIQHDDKTLLNGDHAEGEKIKNIIQKVQEIVKTAF